MVFRALLRCVPFSKRIEREYGGKRPALRAARAWLSWKQGRFDEFGRVDWSRVDRLVFVCLGNICRSPYGELIAREQGVFAASCGLAAQPQDPADPGAAAAALRRGRSLSLHHARSFDTFDWRAGDLAIAFEAEQAEEIVRRMRARLSFMPQVCLLGLWARPRRPHIQDPYSLSPEYFDSCYRVIEDALQRLLQEKHGV
jgi:protein-tyrosine phosphatase